MGKCVCILNKKIGIFLCLLAITACNNIDKVGVQTAQEARQNREELAKVLNIGGNTQAAVSLLEKMARDTPQDPIPLIELGDLYFETGSDVEAEVAYREAIRRGGQLEGEIGLARVALLRNDPLTARDLFWRVLKRDTSNVEAYNGLGVSYDLTGDHKKAQIMYRNVLQGFPDNLDALNNLALSYALSNRAEEAIELMQRVARSPLAGVREQRNLAITYYMAGRVDDALRIDRSVVETIKSMDVQRRKQPVIGGWRTRTR